MCFVWMRDRKDYVQKLNGRRFRGGGKEGLAVLSARRAKGSLDGLDS